MAAAHARRATELADGTDALNLRAEAALARAEAAACAGLSTDAAGAVEDARTLLAAKGNTAAQRALETAPSTVAP